VVSQSVTTPLSRVRLVASYTAGRFPQVYAGLKSHGAEGVVLKRRRALYSKHIRPGVESRDWLKRRFTWD
jgi:ATP-dependent DNA ligase